MILFFSIISLSTAIPVLKDDHSLNALPMKSPVRAQGRRPNLKSELTWGGMLHKAFNDPVTKVDMPPQLKKFAVSMAIVNEDGPMVEKYLDQEIFDHIALESGNDILFKEFKKIIFECYNGMLDPQDMHYKCLISAIEQGKFKFLELLEDAHFDILANIIGNESGSKLVELIDPILKSNILDRYAPQYATNYFRLLKSQNWGAVKLVLKDHFPLTVSNEVTKFPAEKVKSFLALDESHKAKAWNHATYRWILKRTSKENREFAQWLYQKIRLEIDKDALLSKDGSFSIGICFDAASFGDIESAVFFFEEYFKHILGIDQVNTKSESVFQAMEDKIKSMKLRNLASIKAVFRETWKLLMTENGISPDSEYEQKFSKDLENQLG